MNLTDQKIDKMKYSLTEEQIEKLRNALPDLCFSWSPNRTESDYWCSFCKCRANTNYGDITHEPDCFGWELEMHFRAQAKEWHK